MARLSVTNPCHLLLVSQLRACVAAAVVAAAPGALAFTAPVGSLASPVKTLQSRFECSSRTYAVFVLHPDILFGSQDLQSN